MNHRQSQSVLVCLGCRHYEKGHCEHLGTVCQETLRTCWLRGLADSRFRQVDLWTRANRGKVPHHKPAQ